MKIWDVGIVVWVFIFEMLIRMSVVLFLVGFVLYDLMLVLDICYGGFDDIDMIGFVSM